MKIISVDYLISENKKSIASKIKPPFFKLFVLAVFLSMMDAVRGQTNPIVRSLPYTQNFNLLDGNQTTYTNIPGWQGWDLSGSLSTSFPTATPTADRSLVVGSNSNLTRGIYDMNGKLGIASTGSAISTVCLAINTTSLTNISISFKVGTQRNENTRVNELGLQYRVGTAGNFTNVAASSYQNSLTPTNTIGNATINVQNIIVTLPVAAENQSVIQLRWVIRDVSGSGNRPVFSIDDISIAGSSFACTAPSTQATDISLSSVTSGSMVVNWTNGNGDGRVVVMNTANSFAAPTDGSRSLANTSYAGGQQTIFNGTGSGPVTVSGLSSGTTYFFRVYEYCSPGRNHNISSDTNNPNSHTTSIATGSSATDYYRSNSGNTGFGGSWNNAGNWQSSSDSVDWITATLVPTASAHSITIRNGHNINVDAVAGGDQIYVKSGAQLSISANTFTLSNGTSTAGFGGFDLVLEGGTLNRIGGTFIISSGATINFTGTSNYIHAVNGGVIPTAIWSTTSLCNVIGVTSTMPTGFGQQFGRFTWDCAGQNAFHAINDANFNPKGLFTVLNTGTGLYDLNLDNDNVLRTYNFDGGVKVSSVNANFTTTFRTGSTTVLKSVNIVGDLIVENGGYLFLGKGTSTPASGSYRSVVNLNGNLRISGSVSKIISGNTAYLGQIVFAGSTPRTFFSNADVPFDGVHIDVSSGATLLLNSDMELRSTNSSDFDRLNIFTGGNVDLSIFRVFAASGTTQTRFILASGATVHSSNDGGLNTAIATSVNTFSAGANYVFNTATNTPFHAVSTLNNPGSIVINADVTNNRNSATSSLVVTGGLTINNGGIFRLMNAPTLNTPTNDLTLNDCALTINTGGIFDNNGENRIVSGGGSPSVIVSGTFITKDQNGFNGTNTAIPSISIALNPASTVVYGLNGNQTISNFSYQNLLLSGGGIKSTSGAVASIAGTVTINDGVALDVGNNSFGGATTNLTMNGPSRFITSGTQTKPDMAGDYNLANTSTVEFKNSLSTIQTIRQKVYGNIDISGSNVTGPLSGLTLSGGSSFTVKAGGVFKVNSVNGFIGSSNAALLTTNNVTISLEDNSTIEYSGADQTVTSAVMYKNLTLSGAGIKTLSGDIELQGNWSRLFGATFNHNDKAVTFNGSGNSFIAASGGEGFNKLYLNKNSKANQLSLTDSVSIAVEFKITRGLFVLNDKNVTLLSNVNKTASFGQMGSSSSADINYNGIGRFVIERYINTGTAEGQHGKSWQLIATPIKLEGNGDQTIKEAWQEGAIVANENLKSGYGTMLTSNLSDAIVKGFDAYTRPSASIKTWNATMQAWEGPASTSEAASNAKGYMIFVRGDRSVTTASASSNTTILRTKGKLHSPGANAPVIIAMNKEGYHSIGNPYACAIDFSTLNKTSGLSNAFYVFDPTIRGSFDVGAFQTITYDIVGDRYIATPGNIVVKGKSSTLYNSTDDFRYIQSGQAFLVYSFNNSQETITFSESNKVAGSRLAHRPNLPPNEISMLSTNLLAINNNEVALADGNRVVFNDKYSDNVDGNDAIKMKNSGENFGLIRSNRNLAVEARSMLHDGDTVYYDMSGLRQMSYKLMFVPENLPDVSMHAELVDKYLQSRTPISLIDTSYVIFSINADAGSGEADRFMLVFTTKATSPLPVTIISISSNRSRDKNIIVNWKTENEINIKQYELERSSDGISFDKINTQNARANYGKGAAYAHKDEGSLLGVNFYRVKAINENGQFQYSIIVKVSAAQTLPGISVYPNPIVDGKVNIYFTNNTAGNYTIQIANSIGQVVYRSRWNIPAGNNIRTIDNGPRFKPWAIPGVYQLSIFSEKGDSEVISLQVVK